jgi:pimeloyl-[acyl-carrier protein] methyl ester esterase
MMTARTPILRTLFLVSATALALGAGMAATGAMAQPTVVAAPAFASDRLSVEVLGAGPDVVLIPGFASSREVWRAEARRLSAKHRVHMIQLAGFAGDPWAHGDGPLLMPAVHEVARYAATLDRPAIIGHSMGGLTALLVAQAHPEVVSRVMTVDSLPYFGAMFGPHGTPEAVAAAAAQMAQVLKTSEPDAFRTAQAQTAEGMMRNTDMREAFVDWSMTSDRQALAQGITDVMTTDARPGLAAMTTPVWAPYASDANGGAPAAMADAMWTGEYAALPGVRLIRIDDSRHFIMLDQPERFAATVDEFLAE